MPLVHICLGSNLEPRASYLDQAAARLQAEFPEQFKVSRYYLSAPYQGLKQGAYLNAALCFWTELSPQDLLDQLLQIEKDLGRRRTQLKWDERTLDLDIALFGDLVLESDKLTIPHYDLAGRDFFLVPLLELSPKLMDPRTGKSLQVLLAQIPKESLTHLSHWAP
ncbi:MAG: 2-amino-4-hydroxy-6-hydroxymethyldihydropteridine diphosphokinase [Candidatus Lambdaproteobacteria bacterium RIFOXYD12_FULL_49_8]|uniref:2-amino-4-hydroxy-6-hydroxymethyldihydropteridine pyrophosphokinase n=1 Tax=Candidatus Lambdaproteobacteria bacterium RIFOXYD2_FULL_50_16 TaxID=1817772 RepID=A0A1F6GBH3_9PROT|nr:MAG: 2-amino-4-hydroxy-6-hydroxymethyldihydropteridine diphosphokinase [Candidatus Lambdaproteobacteria bacterium RIFOXYD2_FULL_50_16]OGG97737.1 MAG: 2-amino-4-hydroxy-6-hydroxymethyldihydropteridine diphosphokinase [Candidatus Lambdaproteobacteria bacterium RIFOXYD12_FULL_49_8]